MCGDPVVHAVHWEKVRGTGYDVVTNIRMDGGARL